MGLTRPPTIRTNRSGGSGGGGGGGYGGSGGGGGGRAAIRPLGDSFGSPARTPGKRMMQPRSAPMGGVAAAMSGDSSWTRPPTTQTEKTLRTQTQTARAATAGAGGYKPLKKVSARSLHRVAACPICGNTFLTPQGRCNSCDLSAKVQARGGQTTANVKAALKEVQAAKRKERERQQEISGDGKPRPKNCESAGCNAPPLIPGTNMAAPQPAEHVGHSRMDLIEPWEEGGQGERYPPCRTIVYAPSGWAEDEPDERLLNSLPDARLVLDHVYGYRGADCQDNVHWLASGEILFFTAATGIVYNPVTNQQKFFHGHDDDVVSSALFVKYENSAAGGWEEANIDDPFKPEDSAPTRRIAATGQVGRFPLIYVWDTVTLEILARIGGKTENDDDFYHTRQVRGLSFTRDGAKLASFGYDDQHHVAVYDWVSTPPKLLFKCPGHMADLFTIKFNPFSTGAEFVTIGDKHVKFWDASSQQGQNGLFGRLGSTQTVRAVSFVPTGQTLTGVEDGSIYIWDGGAVVGVINAHRGAVTGVKYTPFGIISTGKDGIMKLWDFKQRETPVDTMELSRTLKQLHCGGCHGAAHAAVSIDFVRVGKKFESMIAKCFQKKAKVVGALIIGTNQNTICVAGIAEKPNSAGGRGAAQYEFLSLTNDCVMVAGHSANLHGLYPHPEMDIVATAAEDGTVRLWDYERKQCSLFYQTGKLRNNCVAWHIDNEPAKPEDKGKQYLACGHNDGHFTIYSVGLERGASGPAMAITSLNVHAVGQDRREDIEDIKFSPDTPAGVFLGVASRDNFIDIYSLRDTRPGPPLPTAISVGGGSASPTKRGGQAAIGAMIGGRVSAAESASAHAKQRREDKKQAREWAQDPNKAAEAVKSGLIGPSRLKRTGVCSGHSSYVTHIDFSEEGALMQSTCGANELLYWQVPNGAQNPQTQDIKDTKWATQTCNLGWGLKSTWPACSDGTDINAVSRTKTNNRGGDLLATTDDFGHVKLFRYPVVGSKQKFRAYVGHSSHVLNCHFSHDDRFLFTCGGADMSLFQWRVERIETPGSKANTPGTAGPRGGGFVDDYADDTFDT